MKLAAVKTVSAREANQSFSRLLRRAAAGEEVVITKRGEPVARLLPYPTRNPDMPARRAAVRRMLKLMDKGLHLGNVRFTRDEIYER